MPLPTRSDYLMVTLSCGCFKVLFFKEGVSLFGTDIYNSISTDDLHTLMMAAAVMRNLFEYGEFC